MKVILVDNETVELDNLINVLERRKFDYRVINPNDLSSLSFERADLVILSGGYWYDDPKVFREKYQQEIDFIQKTNIPLISICLGMHLLALAFGGEAKLLTRRYHGPMKLKFNNKFLLQKELDVNQLFFKNHSVGVTRLPDNFEELARSEESSEIMIHKTRPIIGVQFHPEHIIKDQNSEEVWNFLLNRIKLQSKSLSD